jgi:hypothetical protein
MNQKEQKVKESSFIASEIVKSGLCYNRKKMQFLEFFFICDNWRPRGSWQYIIIMRGRGQR